jgi:hypothetical protein
MLHGATKCITVIFLEKCHEIIYSYPVKKRKEGEWNKKDIEKQKVH